MVTRKAELLRRKVDIDIYKETEDSPVEDAPAKTMIEAGQGGMLCTPVFGSRGRRIRNSRLAGLHIACLKIYICTYMPQLYSTKYGSKGNIQNNEAL